LDHNQLTEFVIYKVADLKARDLITLDVSEKSTITDTMLVCSGNSKPHVCAIAENVITGMKHAGYPPLSVEGMDNGEWVLVDLGDIILHVMQDKTRDFYQLEKLWS
jgi:ribosome-associated protein